MLTPRHHLNLARLLIFLLSIVTCSGATASQGVCGLSEEERGSELVLRCQPRDGGLLTCSGGVPGEETAAETTGVESLVLCDWDPEEFDPRTLEGAAFASLRSLTLHAQHDPDIDRWFAHVFPALPLEVLNVSQFGLASLTPEGLFEGLAPTLRILDLSHNRLLTLTSNAITSLPVLQSAFFEGNPWRCRLDLGWLLDTPLSSKLADLQQWTCGPEKFFSKPLLPVLQMMKTLRAQCPSYPPFNCTCELRNVVWGAVGLWPLRRRPNPPTPSHRMVTDSEEGRAGRTEEKDELIPVTVVNCSARGLYRLPPKLPVNTTTLLLAKNMISDVRPLANNEHYRRVLDVFLDHNQVRSIAALEGSEWLSNFRVLSLRGNQLSQIPTYALDHAFLKSRNLAQLYLGSNPWSCDCMFTPGFQDLLAKYQSVVRDVADIRCMNRPGDENALQPIRDLSRSVLCQEGRGASLTGLDILNAALALLIVLVLGKLAYDYWAFKTSGRLPWLVAKMP